LRVDLTPTPVIELPGGDSVSNVSHLSTYRKGRVRTQLTRPPLSALALNLGDKNVHMNMWVREGNGVDVRPDNLTSLTFFASFTFRCGETKQMRL